MIKPETYLVGVTNIVWEGLEDYLRKTKNEEFLDYIKQARASGISDGEILCSFYAKLCYKSLTLGQNLNVTSIREIEKNLHGTIDSGHGSVFEHCMLNFVTTNCSRVFTHELVRHRVGTAFSQTSGRYVAIDDIDLVFPPEYLDKRVSFVYENGEVVEKEVGELVSSHLQATANLCRQLRDNLIPMGAPFDVKKKVTSTIRRLAPNGQTNEIGWSCNIRSLRHMIQMRTSRHAEWEIRVVFSEVADIVRKRWPNILYGGICTPVDGLDEWTNLHI